MEGILDWLSETITSVVLAIVVSWVLLQIFMFGEEREPEQQTNSRSYSYSIFIRNMGWITAGIAVAILTIGSSSSSDTDSSSTYGFVLLATIVTGGLAVYFFVEDRTRYIIDAYGIERHSWRGSLRFDWEDIRKVELAGSDAPYLVLKSEDTLMRVSSYLVGWGEIVYEVCYNATHAEGIQELALLFEEIDDDEM